MRAEAQAYVDRIDAALALLRRFLDWDRALRRLDELNARVEDPTLWDDQKKAQVSIAELGVKKQRFYHLDLARLVGDGGAVTVDDSVEDAGGEFNA